MPNPTASSSAVADVYLGLGSNVGDRLEHLRAAVRLLAQQLDVVRVAPVYETAPVGVTDQPSFLNTAVHAATTLSPQELLAVIKKIERHIGRRERLRWGPREIDIDILLYGQTVIQTPELQIPHPSLAERAFALRPLAHLAPDLVHPVLRRTIAQMLQNLPPAGAASMQPVPDVLLS